MLLTVQLYGQRSETNLKNNTKYGFLFEIVYTDIDTEFGISGTSAFGPSTLTLSSRNERLAVGAQKYIRTSQSTIATNKFRLFLSSENTPGRKIVIKNLRLFELPEGSDINDKFTTLSARALDTYYPISEYSGISEGA